MGKINKGLYSSERHDWMTPPHLLEAILEASEAPYFSLDPCAGSIPDEPGCNVPAETHYFPPLYDGLAEPWFGLVFMNPPYGAGLPKWTAKARAEAEKGAEVWGLLPYRPDTAYFHRDVYGAPGPIFVFRGRVSFIAPSGKKAGSAPFPTSTKYWGPDRHKMRNLAEKLRGSIVESVRI